MTRARKPAARSEAIARAIYRGEHTIPVINAAGLHLEPDDVVVLTVPGVLAANQAERLRDAARQLFPEPRKIAVVSGDTTLERRVRDEAIAIPKGDTVYTIDLDERTVESLERGICPEDLAQRMHDLLRWRREAIRATTTPIDHT